MKDRYQNFIESQQDLSEDEYEDEEIEDEYDEDYEDDEEEEEVQPAKSETAPPPKPFGNGLNIQLGNLRGFGNSGSSNNSSDKNQNPSSPKKNVGYGYTPKQVFTKPSAPEAVKPQPPIQPEPVQEQQPEPVRAARTEPKPEPIDFSPIEEDCEEELKEKRSWKSLGGIFKSRNKSDEDSEMESAEAAEEDLEETPRRRGFFSAILKRRSAEEAEDEEIAAENETAEDDTETPQKRRFGSFFMRKKNRAEDEKTAEETEEEEGTVQTGSAAQQAAAAEMEVEAEESLPSRSPISRFFTSLTERFRGKLGKKETLDEFKQEIAETADEPETAPRKKLRKWQKIGIVSASVCILLAAAYAGGEIFLKQNRQAAEDAAEENLPNTDADRAADEFANLESKAEAAAEYSAELDENLTAEESVSESGIFTETPEEAAAEEELAEIDYFADSGNSVSLENEEETAADSSAEETLADSAEETPADETSSEEISADAAALGTAAVLAAADAVTPDSDSIDFDFGETVTAEKAADTANTEEDISESLAVSETGPAYSQENTGTPEQPVPPAVVPIPAAVPDGQIQSSLAKTGEQDQVHSSLNTAIEKTETFLENTEQQISSAASQVGSSIQNGYNQTVENIQDAGVQVGSSLQNGYDQASAAAQGAGQQISSSIQSAAVSAAAAGTALQGSLNQNDPRNQPLQISLDGAASETAALSLAPSDGRNGGSSLGSNAAADYNPAPAQTAGNAAGATAPQSAADPQTAAAAPAAVSAADAETVFNAEPDLSAMDGFDEIQMNIEPALSPSLSPFGNSYALPQETVPTLSQDTAAVQNSAAGTEQLSNLTYNPADNSASSGYNNAQSGTANGSRAVYGNINQAAAGYREYTTKSGDNLITIAENELGDGSRWSEISKMNPGLNLKGRLQGGIVLRIPVSSGSGN